MPDDEFPPDPADTTREALRVQVEVLRRMSPEERLRQGRLLNETARKLTEAGIRLRHPEYSERDVFFARARLSLGDALFRDAYPQAPILEP